MQCTYIPPHYELFPHNYYQHALRINSRQSILIHNNNNLSKHSIIHNHVLQILTKQCILFAQKATINNHNFSHSHTLTFIYTMHHNSTTTTNYHIPAHVMYTKNHSQSTTTIHHNSQQHQQQFITLFYHTCHTQTQPITHH